MKVNVEYTIKFECKYTREVDLSAGDIEELDGRIGESIDLCDNHTDRAAAILAEVASKDSSEDAINWIVEVDSVEDVKPINK